jgi:hypothetical protein
MLRGSFYCLITVFNYTFIFIQVQEYTKIRRDNCKLNGFFTHFAQKNQSYSLWNWVVCLTDLGSLFFFLHYY